MYKLYTFPDHDTVTAEPSFDPVFADVVQFPVAMDAHLEEYLEREVRRGGEGRRGEGWGGEGYILHGHVHSPCGSLL